MRCKSLTTERRQKWLIVVVVDCVVVGYVWERPPVVYTVAVHVVIKCIVQILALFLLLDS